MSSVTRRGFLKGMLAAAAAPAIVRAASLMPVRTTGNYDYTWAVAPSTPWGEFTFDGTLYRPVPFEVSSITVQDGIIVSIS